MFPGGTSRISESLAPNSCAVRNVSALPTFGSNSPKSIRNASPTLSKLPSLLSAANGTRLSRAGVFVRRPSSHPSAHVTNCPNSPEMLAALIDRNGSAGPASTLNCTCGGAAAKGSERLNVIFGLPVNSQLPK